MSIINTVLGLISLQCLTNNRQAHLPAPQPIPEETASLTERAVQLACNVPQAVRNDIETVVNWLYPSITCTPEEFKRLLSQNYRFPPKVIVTGSLSLNRDSSIKTLPAGLEVQGTLSLLRCYYLESLPVGLIVHGSLMLFGCENLVLLPAGIVVDNDIDLSDCKRLKSIGEGLRVGRDLLLDNCSKFRTLPTGLVVPGRLIITYSKIRLLPQGLSVGEDLDLGSNRRLIALTEDLQLGGDLHLYGCIRLTSLPNWITTLGARADGSIRTVNLIETGLSDSIMERLRQIETQGMQFDYSHAASDPATKFSTLDEALTFWLETTNDKALIKPVLVLDREMDLLNVVEFLSRLTTTEEYKNLQTRPLLACRVLEMLNQIELKEEMKARACDYVFQGLTSCDDRIISALEEIELMLLLEKIENTDHTAEELMKLGKRFLFLEMVNAKAKAHKATLKWVDEIEIYLAFQIGLADRFDLPFKTRNMIFRGCAQVTDAQLAQFGDEIELACTDAKLDAFLKNWSPWVKFQRNFVPAFEELEVIDRELASDDICIFTQETPQQPVLYNGHVYDYNAFVEQYRKNGTDPMDRSKIEISQLKRINKSE